MTKLRTCIAQRNIFKELFLLSFSLLGAGSLGLTGGQVRERYLLLCNGSDYKALQNTLEGFEARDDDYVEACIAQGGFIHREVIDGAVFTFDWRGMVSHERRAA